MCTMVVEYTGLVVLMVDWVSQCHMASVTCPFLSLCRFFSPAVVIFLLCFNQYHRRRGCTKGKKEGTACEMFVSNKKDFLTRKKVHF